MMCKKHVILYLCVMGFCEHVETSCRRKCLTVFIWYMTHRAHMRDITWTRALTFSIWYMHAQCHIYIEFACTHTGAINTCTHSTHTDKRARIHTYWMKSWGGRQLYMIHAQHTHASQLTLGQDAEDVHCAHAGNCTCMSSVSYVCMCWRCCMWRLTAPG